MKKLKFLLPLILALAMVLTVPFAAACKKRNKNGGGDGGEVPPPPVVTTEVISISLDTAGVKKEFYTGESFSYSGLVVNALVKDSNKTETETRNVTALAKINAGAYNRDKMGTYNIGVSYEGKTASYSVNVTKADLVWTPNSNFKDLYLVGQELVDLKENGKFYLETQRPGEESKTSTEVTNSVTIDKSAFKNDKEDQYAIKASYRMPALAAGFTANYPVETSVYVRVIESREGLNVTLADGVDEVIPLSGTTATATIDPTGIVVKRVDEYGNVVNTPLTTSEYDVQLWKENEQVDDSYLDTDGKYKNLTGGVYQLWAYADSERGNSERLSGFAIIKVADEVVSISVDQKGYTSQEAGLDYISSHWEYTITYISTATRKVTSSEVSLDFFDTKTVGENITATVSYTETNAAGKTNTVSKNVKYTITASSLTTLPKETFVIKNIADAATKYETVIPTDSDGEGGEITDNALFTITTQGEMKWTEAKGSATSAATKWITNVALLDGTTVDKFDVGLSQTATTNGGEETPTLTFTAKNDITLKAYLILCNAPYNSDRPGTLIATITHEDGSVTKREISGVGSSRDSYTNLTFDLYDGDVLVITIRNEDGSGRAATLWFFGAEATGYKNKSVEGGN